MNLKIEFKNILYNIYIIFYFQLIMNDYYINYLNHLFDTNNILDTQFVSILGGGFIKGRVIGQVDNWILRVIQYHGGEIVMNKYNPYKNFTTLLIKIANH